MHNGNSIVYLWQVFVSERLSVEGGAFIFICKLETDTDCVSLQLPGGTSPTQLFYLVGKSCLSSAKVYYRDIFQCLPCLILSVLSVRFSLLVSRFQHPPARTHTHTPTHVHTHTHTHTLTSYLCLSVSLSISLPRSLSLPLQKDSILVTLSLSLGNTFKTATN